MYRIKCIEPEDTTIIYRYRFSMSNIHGVARKYGGGQKSYKLSNFGK